MNINRLKRLMGFAVMIVSTLAGCSGADGLERVGVSGGVTFHGQPVAEGQIRFVPKFGTKSSVVVEAIADGRYATTKYGGVPVGSYRVEILAYDPSAPDPTFPGDRPRPQLLPPQYNTQSKLELVVEAGQKSIARDFELVLSR